MPKGNPWGAIFGQLPLKKLRRYEVANLAFEIIALFFTLRFTLHHNIPVADYGLWVFVIVMGTVCIFWASKQ